MKHIGLVFLLTLLLSGLSLSQTNVSGTISTNTLWDTTGSPYIVIGHIYVNDTLAIDSGVVVRFTSGTALYVNSLLTADHVVFTSSKDTVGGTPVKGDWAYIQVGQSSSGTAVLSNCTIKYGGTSSPQNVGAVRAAWGTVTLASCDINNSKNHGLDLSAGATANLSNISISACEWPIFYGGQASLVFNNTNTLIGNAHDGIYIGFGNTSTYLRFDTASVPYVFLGSFTVDNGATLDIASGNILKFGWGCWLYVRGTLIANAGSGQTVYFTAYTDDNLGGDTNADGTASIPGDRYWGAVWFYNESNDAGCVMRRCRVSYGGNGNYGGIGMDDASPTIDSCSMVSNYYGIMMRGVSNPVFTNNTIGSSVMTPIAMSFSCNPVFNNNTFSFSDNTYDAIGLLGGTLPADANIPIRSVTSVANVVYVLLEDVTVPVGRTLTIQPGVVLKGFTYWNRIYVQGKLIANGTSGNPIVMTSIRDDNFGGDTNKDGTQSSPGKYDWGGILFDASSDTNSSISYCKLKYGYVPYYGGVVSMANASPTISNCDIKDVEYGIFAYQASNPKILNDTITNTTYTPIAMSVSADPIITGVVFNNAGWTALGIIGENLGFSGTIKRRDVAGFSNITYVLLGNLTINAGTNVTVEPGVVIKLNDGVGIWVNGGFRAKGTIANGQIIFTGIRDDNAGNPGDTNGDGQASAPGRGNWQTIRFQAASDDGFCLLDSVQVRYAGWGGGWGGVTYTDASGSLRNSTIINSDGYGVRCEGASLPTVDNILISTCRLDPIAMSLLSDPNLTNITFAGNGSQGIRILEGTLSTNAHLRKRDVAGISNIAYIIDGLTVGANAVLTIDPGVVIKNAVNGWNGIWVAGALVADGTATEHIVFTSIRDDSKGGDTNNDGNSTTPDRGYWHSIGFGSSGLDSLNSLKNCEIRYAGSGAGAYSNWGEIRVYDAKVVVDSCSIDHSATSAFGVYGSATPIFRNCQINNASWTPVMMSMFSQPTFENIAASNMGEMALGITPETYSVDDTIPMRDFAGYSNITYRIFDYISVNSGTTIHVPAGVVFKGGRVNVYGGLIVDGTKTQPVVFTHIADDTYGNPKDTQGNGFTSPDMNWSIARIYFADVSDDANCILRNAILRYAENGVSLQQASPEISNCRFDQDYAGIVLNGVSQPAVDSCVFNNIWRAPIYMSIVSYPRSTVGNTISGTTWRGLRILDETLSQSVILPKRSFAGINNIPYIFGTYTVGTSAVLTVEPGVVIKFEQNGYLVVRKGLLAQGGSTPDSNIVFTSLRDDFYGGDTNADSNATGPWIEYWGAVQFANESIDDSCKLKYCTFRYGGGYWQGRGAVYTNSASPRIEYCSFNNNRNAVFVTAASNPVINNCDIYQCTEMGVYNYDKTFNIDARYNWWGDNSGPYHAVLNPTGLGVPVSDSVTFAPYATQGSQRPKLGDVSLNGSIQAYDASLILKHVALIDTLTPKQQSVADVSGSAGITAFDASLILQYVVGLITTFPAESIGTVAPLGMPKVTATAIDIGDVQGTFGSTITVPVRFTGTHALASADIVLKYNSAVFTPVEVTLAAPLADMVMVKSFRNGEIRIAIAGSKYIDVDGDALSLKFNVAPDVRGTITSSIGFSKVMLNEVDFISAVLSNKSTILGKPTAFALHDNYPNPFNPSTRIAYDVPDDGAEISIVIYNSVGEVVKTLVDGVQNAGTHEIVWDATNDQGAKVGSGVYYYRFAAQGAQHFSTVKKMLLVK